MLPTRKRRCPPPKAIPYVCPDLVMCLFQIAPCDTRRAMRLVCREWNYVCTKYRAKPFECCGTPVQFKYFRFWSEIPEDQIPTVTGFICQRQYKEEIETGLSWASLHGNVDILKLLLTGGADVRLEYDEALRHASKNGHLEVVSILLAAGADVHASDDYPLRMASVDGHAEVVKVLLTAGANVHARNDWALRLASSGGHAEVVKLLLTAGANVHAWNGQALQIASSRGHEEVVRVLRRALYLETLKIQY